MARRLDPEFVALAAGYKPAVRLSVSALEAPALVEQWRSRGFVALLGEPLHDAPELQRVLYVARTEALARAALVAEAPILPGKHLLERALEEQAQLALARALGFPACCALAWVELERSARATLDASSERMDWLAARSAWVSQPEPLLNTLLLPGNVRVLSWTPCTFRCELSLRYARAVFARLERSAYAEARALYRSLAVCVAVGSRGERALVHRVHARIESATGFRRGESPEAERDAVFAAGLVHKTLNERGWVQDVPDESDAPVVVDFREQ